jgi:biopolymer transport protein ExbD
MNFSRRSQRRDYIHPLPLVALIDVCFFLLLYFIMAGSLAEPEGDLSAAITTASRGSGRGNDFSSQIVYVENEDGQARYRLAGRIMTTKADLAAVLAQLPKEPGVIIRVADDVSVGVAAAAVQASKDAGFRKVTYVAGK